VQLLEATTFKQHFGIELYDHYILIGTLCIAVAFFMFFSSNKIKSNKLSEWGRKYSLFIYLYHPIALYLFASLLKRTPPTIANHIAIFNPIIVFTITLGTAIMLDKKLHPFFNKLTGNLFIKNT
jgi:peptidoglycan/LPS O-acetylase OafA/YrhL